MSDLNFPVNPDIGDTHTIGLKTYVWNGYAWIVQTVNVVEADSITATTVLVTSSSTALTTNTGALVVSGGVGIGENIIVGSYVSADSYFITGIDPFRVLYTDSERRITGHQDFIYDPDLNTLSVTSFYATTASNIRYGNIGYIPIQTEPNVTSFIQPGNTGDLLQSFGTTASFVSTSSLTVGFANTATSVKITNETLNSATHYITFVSNYYGEQQIKVNNESLTFNPETKTLGLTGILSLLGGESKIEGEQNLYLGAATGNIIAENIVNIQNTTSATSTTTGALIVNGGVGVGGDLWISGDLYAGGEKILTTASFNTLLNEGADIDISINTETNFLIISNTSTLETVTARGSSTSHAIHITNITESTSTSTGALVVDGGIGANGNIWAHGRVTAESVKIADAILDSTVITINTTATTVVDQYPIDQFRSAKYLIQIDEGAGETADFQVIEILLLVDNIGTVYATEYGLLTTNGDMGEFAAGVFDVGGVDKVQLFFTAYYPTDKSIKVLRTGMSV